MARSSRSRRKSDPKIGWGHHWRLERERAAELREFTDLPQDRLQGLLDISLREVLEMFAYLADVQPDRFFEERTGLWIQRPGIIVPEKHSEEPVCRVALKGPRPFVVKRIRVSCILHPSQVGGVDKPVQLILLERPGWRDGRLFQLSCYVAPKNEVHLLTGLGYTKRYLQQDAHPFRFETGLTYEVNLLFDFDRHLASVLLFETETEEEVVSITLKASKRFKEIRPDNLVLKLGEYDRQEGRPPLGWTFEDLAVHLEP